MAESFSDLQRLFAKPVTARAFGCRDEITGKTIDIDKNDIVSFFKYYCDVNFVKDYAEWKNEPVLSLSEKTESYIPAIGEFELKVVDGSDIDESEHIETIINEYQSLLKKHFSLSDDSPALICVYLRSEMWWDGGVGRRKFRLQFPFCKTKRDIVNSVINKEIVTTLNRCADIAKLTGQIGTWEDAVVDVGEYITLYGSTAHPKLVPPLKYISILGTKGESGVHTNLRLEDVSAYQKHSLFQKYQCATDMIDDDNDLDDDLSFAVYTLPILLSVNYGSGKVDFNNMHATESSVAVEEDENSVEARTDYELCNVLVGHTAPKRFNKKIYFLDIGRAYYNATDGGSGGLAGWIKSASRSKQFNRQFCEEHYDKFENDKVTVKTLGWYFKSDNRRKYERWHNEWCRYTFIDAMEGEHTKVGEAFYKQFWLKYMYTGRRWLEFRRNKLVYIDEIKLKRTISNDFIPEFDKLMAIMLSEKLQLSVKQNGSRAIQARMKKIDEDMEKVTKLKKQLRNENYLSSIVKSLRTFFYQEDVTNALNKNPSLLGCSNCVIELTDSDAVKRDGKPEDFITKKIGVVYRNDYTSSHPDVVDLLRYLRQVFPNDEIRDYMTKDLASLMYGRNSEKIFRVWIGDTNGSKSVLQKMIRHWLGDYYCDLPAEFFSGKKMNSSGPSPELAQTENARVAFTAEPDDDESWKGARIKKLTGGDSFFARSCGEDGGSIETTFSNIMVLNVVPDITGMDEATKNRFFMVPFEGRWVKPDETRYNVPETFEEQVKAKIYRMDPRFEDHIPRLAAALNWYCIQNYKKYLDEGLRKPNYIQNYMDEYWKRNDPYTAFIDENLEIPRKADGSADDNKYVTATDLYPIYKRWFKSSYPNFQLVQKARFTTFLSSPDRLGKQRTRRWYGYSIRQTTEGEQDILA